jgi:hypothetical protein
MQKKNVDVVAQTRRALEPTWKCNGDKMRDWVCPDGRKVCDHTQIELGVLARELKHRAVLHLRRAKRLVCAADLVVNCHAVA